MKMNAYVPQLFKSGRLAALGAVCVFATTMSAAQIMPDLANVPVGWTTDRYEPASFTNFGTVAGRSNVLGIGINATTSETARPPGQQGAFYNTQGRKLTFAPVAGPGSILSADLYIPASWADSANGHRRSDVWGTMVDSANAISAYPIIGFTNYGGSPRLRVYDGDVPGGWIDLPTTISYDTWTSLAIELLADTSIKFYVNGALVYTDSSTGGSVAFKEVIMQAFNFEHSSIPAAVISPYVAYWSNTPGPASLTCVGFVAPLNQVVIVKKKSNRVLPFKMQILDENGVPQTNADIAAPVIEIQFGSITLGGTSGDDLLSSGRGDEGNQFTYNGDGTWQFNLNSKQFTAPGTYTVTAVSGDSAQYSLNVITGQFIIQ